MNLKSISSLRYFFWAGLFLALIFTVIKPGFVGDTSFFTSLLFWSLHIGLLLPLLIFVQDSLQSTTLLNHYNAWGITAISGAFAAVFFVPLALLLDYLFSFDDWSHVTTLNQVIFLACEEIAAIILPVTFSWISMNAPRILQLNFEMSTTPATDDKKNTPVNAHFFTLLPHSIGKDIVYMASELHYLRVVTIQGEALILYSLQNAIKDLETHYEGVQTHRSYWVNRAHIDKIIHTPTCRHILTKQDQLIPISRRQYKSVKDLVNR